MNDSVVNSKTTRIHQGLTIDCTQIKHKLQRLTTEGYGRTRMNNTHEHKFLNAIKNVHFAVMVTTIVLNIILLLLIVNQKKLRKKHSSKFFLNLQAVHIGLSISSIISTFTESSMEMHLYNAFLMMMFLALLMMTCERYLAIKLPYKYGKLTSHVNDIIICSWIPPFVFVFLAKIFRHSEQQNVMMGIGLIAVAAIFLTTSNASIYFTVRKHFNVINKEKLKNSPINLTISKESKRLKSVYVCFAIVFAFLLLWFPYFIYDLLTLTNTYTDFHEYFIQSVQPIALLNSLLDPILFVCFRHDVKKELRRLLRIRGSYSCKQSFTHAERVPMRNT